jgi:molybdate transport system substrate-binding protein
MAKPNKIRRTKMIKVEKGKSGSRGTIKLKELYKVVLFAIIALFILVPSAVAAKGELDFFCGAAVAVPMQEIIKNYQKEKGIKVNVIYHGSGTLLSQMKLSNRGDVYLCGSPDYITIGERKGLLIKGTDKLVSYLVPAIIVPKGNPQNIHSLEDLAKKGVKVGMGNPETVCLGLYGAELLDRNGLLEKVLPNTVVFAKSCEDTATLAVLRKVDAILGWDVFETWNPDKVEWIKIAPDKIPRIAYIPIAIPVFVKDRTLAQDFINYVLSERGSSIFKKWGYIFDEREAKRHAPKATIGGEYKLPEKYYRLIRRER